MVESKLKSLTIGYYPELGKEGKGELGYNKEEMKEIVMPTEDMAIPETAKTSLLPADEHSEFEVCNP